MKTDSNSHWSLIWTILCIAGISCNKKHPDFDGSGAFFATEIVISAETAGIITDMSVAEGDQIAPGQTIALIDTTLFHLQKSQILAQIRSLESGLPDLHTQIRYFDDQISLAQTKLEHLEKERDRIQNLSKVNAATVQQVDEISNQVVQAQMQIEIIKSQKQAQISTISNQRQSHLARPLPYAAQLDLISEQIKRAVITAPVDGIVLSVYNREGEYTTPGKPLLKMARLQDIKLKAYIPAHVFSNIKLHQQVEIRTDDGSDGYYIDSGRITWISPKAEFTPKSVQTPDVRQNQVYAVEVSVANPEGRYKIGMYGEIKL